MDLPFDPDTTRTMTLKETVIEARRLRAQGLSLEKEGKELKKESSSYQPKIREGLEELDTDSMKFDGKAVTLTERDVYQCKAEHKADMVKWCIENNRIEFLTIINQALNSACKAAVEVGEELPPQVELTSITKLNGI